MKLYLDLVPVRVQGKEEADPALLDVAEDVAPRSILAQLLALHRPVGRGVPQGLVVEQGVVPKALCGKGTLIRSIVVNLFEELFLRGSTSALAARAGHPRQESKANPKKANLFMLTSASGLDPRSYYQAPTLAVDGDGGCAVLLKGKAH